VVYEPSNLGDARAQLHVTSPTGGDYVCTLVGQCTAPRPQGPVWIKPGSATNLTFKNVLASQATFAFSIVGVVRFARGCATRGVSAHA
jgi:hydrocephalus-inducing protein